MRVIQIKKERDKRKKRVAAYCRVSTRFEEQEKSLETQIAAYQYRIMERDDWDFAGIYFDEKSGTNAQNRMGFHRLIRDAFAGEIDLILVKSISRFSRNVVECEEIIKLLRGQGVEVQFEREGISSFDSFAGMMLSILAAIAQDESRSISENVKWSHAKRVARGEYNLGSNRVLGYDCMDGKLIPNYDAWMVKLIFQLFLKGIAYEKIAVCVEERGGHRMRSSRPFNSSAILAILQNETYMGDKLLQKQAPKNYLTKRPNERETFQSNYLREDHEAIVSRKEWETVQEILGKRREDAKRGIHYRGGNQHFLYGKIFCGSCGAVCTRRTEKGYARKGESAKYYKTWICTEHLKGRKGNHCKNPATREEVILEKMRMEVDMDWEESRSRASLGFWESGGRIEIRDRKFVTLCRGIVG